MFKKGRRILILGVLFTVLLYAEGEQENSGGSTPKESEVTIKEERRKTPAVKENESRNEVEQVSGRSSSKYSDHNSKRNKHQKHEGNTVSKGELTSTNSKEKNISTKNNNNKPIQKKKFVKAIEREKEGESEYQGEVIKFIATTDGKILKDKMSRQQHPIASLTKVMNILVALDQIDRGNAKIDDKVCFTPDTVNMGGSWLNAKAGDCYTLKDLLRAEIIYSANNAAYMVAKHIGKGNSSNFISICIFCSTESNVTTFSETFFSSIAKNFITYSSIVCCTNIFFPDISSFCWYSLNTISVVSLTFFLISSIFFLEIIEFT